MAGPAHDGYVSAMLLPAKPRAVALVILFASAAILASALAFQYLGGLAPCVLCIYQRWPYVITIVASAIAAALARGMPGAAGTLLGVCGLTFVVGAGVAAFHAGVEQHWWAGTASCGDTTTPADSLEALKRQLLAQPVVRCDAVAWSFLSLSMATWNMLLSLGLGALSCYGAVATRGCRHGA